jgi:hypothetical protein
MKFLASASGLATFSLSEKQFSNFCRAVWTVDVSVRMGSVQTIVIAIRTIKLQHFSLTFQRPNRYLSKKL